VRYNFQLGLLIVSSKSLCTLLAHKYLFDCGRAQPTNLRCSSCRELGSLACLHRAKATDHHAHGSVPSSTVQAAHTHLERSAWRLAPPLPVPWRPGSSPSTSSCTSSWPSSPAGPSTTASTRATTRVSLNSRELSGRAFHVLTIGLFVLSAYVQ
jgi:hypothetical protein